MNKERMCNLIVLMKRVMMVAMVVMVMIVMVIRMMIVIMVVVVVLMVALVPVMAMNTYNYPLIKVLCMWVPEKKLRLVSSN